MKKSYIRQQIKYYFNFNYSWIIICPKIFIFFFLKISKCFLPDTYYIYINVENKNYKCRSYKYFREINIKNIVSNFVITFFYHVNGIEY